MITRILIALGALLLAPAACSSDEDTGNVGAGGTGGNDAGNDAASGAGGSDAGDACPPGTRQCSSACAEPSDPSFGCGAVTCAPCSSTNGTPSCADGACSIACAPGFDDCNADVADGCEAALDTSSACGACGVACEVGESCVAGSCQVVCGDGAVGAGEHCDDGNTKNLDGCDDVCRYEMFQRMTALTIVQGQAPPFCTPSTNRFGEVFPDFVVEILNDDLKNSIDTASLSLLIQILDLDDLAGVNDSSLSLGILNAELDPKQSSAWSPGKIDHWFIADPSSLDAQGKPLSLVSGGSIASGALMIDAPLVALPFAGSTLELSAAHLRASVDNPPAPDVPGPPPATLASGLVVFRSLTASGVVQGLCGNASVASLAQIPLPKTFAAGGQAACVEPSQVTCLSPPAIPSHVYTWCGEHCGNPGDPDYDASGCASCAPARCNSNPVGPACNSLLDAMVGGCVVNPPDCVTAFLPTQPDVGSAGQPPKLLAGDPQNNHKVSVAEPSDGYSAYLRFSANRAHATNNLP